MNFYVVMPDTGEHHADGRWRIVSLNGQVMKIGIRQRHVADRVCARLNLPEPPRKQYRRIRTRVIP